MQASQSLFYWYLYWKFLLFFYKERSIFSFTGLSLLLQLFKSALQCERSHGQCINKRTWLFSKNRNTVRKQHLSLRCKFVNVYVCVVVFPNLILTTSLIHQESGEGKGILRRKLVCGPHSTGMTGIKYSSEFREKLKLPHCVCLSRGLRPWGSHFSSSFLMFCFLKPLGFVLFPQD